jgi:hypothetical protein
MPYPNIFHSVDSLRTLTMHLWQVLCVVWLVSALQYSPPW